MKNQMRLSPQWDDICVSRMGVAELTRMAFDGKDLRPLWHEMMEKATDDVAGSGLGMDLSVISQLLGDQPTGLAIQNDTLALNTLYRSPCAADRPRLRILALAAVTDIGGNTPLEFLLQGSDIELATFYIVPGAPLPSPLPDHDIAIVVAPDADNSRACLKIIEELAAVWPRPILNAPANIEILDRDRLYHCLQGIPGLVIPQTARIPVGELQELASDAVSLQTLLADGAFPLIIRPIGSHAGFGLAKLEDGEALARYLSERQETEFFLSSFIDYAGADTMFRKYRIVIVDGKPYACHMAIADEWKVWYLNADMAVSVPYRLEEALFMELFDQDFAARHADALGQMSDRIGLDYFIIDCAETRDGKLLVFEADNTAIVHDMDPPSVYPYKSSQMRKIFRAVQTMMYRRAGRIADAA
jgi:hypothetical protein